MCADKCQIHVCDTAVKLYQNIACSKVPQIRQIPESSQTSNRRLAFVVVICSSLIVFLSIPSFFLPLNDAVSHLFHCDPIEHETIDDFGLSFTKCQSKPNSNWAVFPACSGLTNTLINQHGWEFRLGRLILEKTVVGSLETVKKKEKEKNKE